MSSNVPLFVTTLSEAVIVILSAADDNLAPLSIVNVLPETDAPKFTVPDLIAIASAPVIAAPIVVVPAVAFEFTIFRS